MPTRNPSPSEVLSIVTELSQWYGLGELASRAGISGGPDLLQQSTEVLAAVAVDLDLDLETAAQVLGTTGIESGQLGSRLLAAAQTAWGALARNARSMVDTARRSKGLVLTFGGLYIAHDWLTSDQQIALSEVREKGDFVRAAWNASTPQERAAITEQYLAETATGPSIGTIALVALGLAGGWLIYRIVREAR